MFPFLKNSLPPRLPSGFVLETVKLPSPQELNRLLSSCNEKTHPPNRLSLALKNSVCCLSIFDEANGKLAGFVRATSDYGLNANLWNLSALPGDFQKDLLAFLIFRVLGLLRKDLPGCSISVAAPSMAFGVLEEQGFLLDPNGIRSMEFRLR